MSASHLLQILACAAVLLHNAAHVTPASVASDPCACVGGVVGGKCYDTLVEAIASAPNGGTVQFGTDQIISSTISISSSIGIGGVACGGRQKPSISVDINDKTSAFYLSSKKHQNFQMENFDMAPAEAGQLSSAVRSADRERTLSVKGVSFVGFKQLDVNGTVIMLDQVRSLDIDAGSRFEKNVLATDPEPKETGGQLHIGKVYIVLACGTNLCFFFIFIFTSSSFPLFVVIIRVTCVNLYIDRCSDLNMMLRLARVYMFERRCMSKHACVFMSSAIRARARAFCVYHA